MKNLFRFVNFFITKKKQHFLSNILAIPCIAYLCIGLYKAFCNTGDGFTRWKECAYVFRGINPIDLSSGTVQFINSIGPLGRDVTTVPWSYTLANFLYPGFCSWPIAHIYSIILFLILLTSTCIVLFHQLKKHGTARPKCLLVIIILFSHCGWYSSLDKLNPGMYVCICLILVVIVCHYYSRTLKTDLILGLLMTIGMLKPQIALLFYIPLFWQKRLRPIIISCILLTISWGTAALMCHANPLSILFDQFQIGTELDTISGYVYYGILDFLIGHGFSTTSLLVIQMLLFSTLAFIIGYRYRYSSSWIQFSVSAMFSILWCYHHNMDIAIIGIMMTGIAFLIQDNILSCIEKIYCVFLLFFNVIPISYALYEISSFIPILQRFLYLIGLFILLKHESNLQSP